MDISTWPFCYFIMTVALFQGSCGESQLSWNEDTVNVRLGDSVKVTCTVENVDFLEVVRVELVAGDSIVRTISDSANVKQPFAHITRYNVSYQFHGTTGKMTIHYLGVRGDDAGVLRCFKLGKTSNIASLQLNVQVPVSDVMFVKFSGQTWTKINSSLDSVRLRELESGGFACVVAVDSVLVRPDVHISVEGHDWTHQFTMSQRQQPLPPTDDSASTLIRSLYQLTYVSMKPERSFNGRVIECTASMQGFPSLSATANVIVEYAPAIMCHAYEHFVQMSSPLTVTCRVEANPSGHILWQSATVTVQTDSLVSAMNQNVSLHETVVNSDSVQVQVMFHSIEHANYGTYFLSAENEIGSSEVTIVVHPVDSVDGPPMSTMDKMAQFRALMAMSSAQSSITLGLSAREIPCIIHQPWLLFPVLLMVLARCDV